MNTVEFFPSSEGILRKKRKNMEKISLLCFESCCGIFGIEGEKGALMRIRPYSCTWINYWFGLLLLLDYYVLVLMKIGSWEVWKNTRKIAILVFLDLESELWLGQKYFFVMKMKMNKNDLNPQFDLFCNMVGLIPESNYVMNKNRRNRFLNVFPLFLTGTPLHLESDCTEFVILFWKVYSLSNRSAAAPMRNRSRGIARVMVPSPHLKSWWVTGLSNSWNQFRNLEPIVTVLFVLWLVDAVWGCGSVIKQIIRERYFDILTRSTLVAVGQVHTTCRIKYLITETVWL